MWYLVLNRRKLKYSFFFYKNECHSTLSWDAICCERTSSAIKSVVVSLFPKHNAFFGQVLEMSAMHKHAKGLAACPRQRNED